MIKEMINKKIKDGYSLRDAQNVVAEEIIINKIASSELVEHVTFKGGIVMYNLSKNNRRVTQDVDFDLIRYSIDKDSIRLLIDKMNRINDGFMVTIKEPIEDLHQDDYKGVRVNVVIKDINNDILKLKLDIGVHTYLAIEQTKMTFAFSLNKEKLTVTTNPPEQVFAEKLISLARHGALSTRYKDLYDFYYLINNYNLSPKRVTSILELFFSNSAKRPNSITDLQNAIEETLNNERFIKEASKPASKWIDVDFATIKQTLIDFINHL